MRAGRGIRLVDGEQLDPALYCNARRSAPCTCVLSSIHWSTWTTALGHADVGGITWEANDWPPEWTIDIRKNVQFHDGTPLTAADVIYTIKRLIDPTVNSPAISELGFIKPENLVQVDDYTVRLNLDQPELEVPIRLASKYMHIIKHGTTTSIFRPAPSELARSFWARTRLTIRREPCSATRTIGKQACPNPAVRAFVNN